MKSKGRGVNALGVVLALVTMGIVVLSIVYITRHRVGKRWRDVTFWKDQDFGSWERTDEERSVKGDFDSLHVHNISGKIEIKGWNRDYAQVQCTKRGPFAKELDIITAVNDGTLWVHPEQDGKIKQPFASVTFDIMVPKGVSSIIAESTSGSIALSGMESSIDQELRSVSGRIETDNARDLSASTTRGSIRFRFSGSRLYVKTVSGSVSGDILALSSRGSCELTSVSGSVTLSAFDELSTRVLMKSTSGSVVSEFPIQWTQKKNNELKGTIGDGAAFLSIRTTSGSIKLNRL